MLIPKELIIKAKETFGIKAVEIISNGLELKSWDNKHFKSICPFHGEDTPSFIWNKKENCFKCFGCGKTYGIIDYYQDKGMTFYESVKKLFNDTNVEFDFDDNSMYKYKEYKFPKAETNKNRNAVEEYLKKRCISKETLDFAGIKEDKNHNIVFEYYNENDILLTVKYRPAKKLKKNETKTWCQKDADTSPILYGMNKIDPVQPLLICEGEIDRLACIESGFKNVVSVPFGANNYGWIEYNWDWLEQFDKIIIWSDNDDAGMKMKGEIIPRLGTWRCYEATGIENDINLELYKHGKQAVLDIINNAKEVPINDVIDLADVKDFDITNAEGITSNIKGLDKWIGKFYFGTVNIVTGINGCVDNKTEFFNGYQWKSISEYTLDDMVLQYNYDGTTSLIKPIEYIKQPCDEFYLIKTKYGINQCVTKEHTIIYNTQKKKDLQSIQFSDLYEKHLNSDWGFYGKIITTFKPYGSSNINLTDDEIRLMVAISADGNFPRNTTRCRMRLKKQRKIDRLRYLLEKCNIPYEEKIYNETNSHGFVNFYFYAPMCFKEFPKDWYNTDESQFRIIFDEIYKWDGYEKEKQYSTTIKNNADFIQYVITSLGFRSVIYEDIRENRNTCYSVTCTPNVYLSMLIHKNDKYKNNIITEYNEHDGYKYCFTVPSGMLVLRRENRINITGNSGKSTFIDQVCICEPLEQGYKTFVFSGELTKSQLKSWLEYPLAGRKHIDEIDRGEFQPKGYIVKKEIKNKMADWYRSKIYIYDNDLDYSATSILNKMKELARKYGVKNFVLDNLMMIDLECNEHEKYTKQKEFVINLIRFAKQFNSVVHLVAHPRKVETIRRLSKMDVSGSGDITNLSHYVISIHRVTDKEKEGIMNGKGDWTVNPIEYDCLIDLFKNRPNGYQDKTVGIHYDIPSKRFYGDSDDKNKSYSWDKTLKKESEVKFVEDTDLPY